MTSMNSEVDPQVLSTAYELEYDYYRLMTLENTPREEWREPSRPADFSDLGEGAAIETDAAEQALTEYLEEHPELVHESNFESYYSPQERADAALAQLAMLREARAATQTEIETVLRRSWAEEAGPAREAALVVERGPGRFWTRRAEVRDAHQHLTNWAQRWEEFWPALGQMQNLAAYAANVGPESLTAQITEAAVEGARDLVPGVEAAQENAAAKQAVAANSRAAERRPAINEDVDVLPEPAVMSIHHQAEPASPVTSSLQVHRPGMTME